MKKKRLPRRSVIRTLLVVFGVSVIAGIVILTNHSRTASSVSDAPHINMRQLNDRFMAMGVTANATHDAYKKLLVSYTSADIAATVNAPFDHTCYVGGNGYPGDKHSLICTLRNSHEYVEHFPAPGLDQAKGQKFLQDAKHVGENLHYDMKFQVDDTDTPVSVRGTRDDCDVELGYALTSGVADSPNPVLTYRLECRHAVFENRPGTFQIQCSEHYANILPDGYRCDY